MEVVDPTPEELEGLQTGGKVSPPAPPTEVIERAKVIVDAAKNGIPLSAWEEQVGDKTTKSSEEPEADDVIDKSDKVGILANILTGTAFRKSYSLFDGEYTLVFKSISASTDQFVMSLVLLDELDSPQQSTKANRSARYDAYSALAALDAVKTKDGTKHPDVFPPKVESYSDATLRSVRDRARTFTSSLSKPVYTLIRSYYARFNRLVNTLLDQADNPSFWQTP